MTWRAKPLLFARQLVPRKSSLCSQGKDVVQYDLDLLKRCLCCARRNPRNCFLAKTTVILIFIDEQWLVIMASWEDQAAVVFVSNKFMSSCAICLVSAREIFLLQSDCSAITKAHNFFRCWAYFLINLFCRIQNNLKSGGHFIHIG